VPTPLDVAVVVRLEDVRWGSMEGPVPEEGSALGSRRLRLLSGRVTLALLNGVMLAFEGPADLELISVDRALCHQGKVRLRVPSGVQGFVLSGPGSNVVDLGTEFGLNVTAEGKTQIMVFKGGVDAAAISTSGSALRWLRVPKPGALEIDPEGLRIYEVESRPEDFATLPSLAIPPLKLVPSYRAAVLEARPWGYWRFEAINDGAVSNEIAGRPPLRLTGPVHLAGAGNRSAAFGSDEAEQSLLMDGNWTPPRQPGYAIELWFAPERIGEATLASLYRLRGETDYKNLVILELWATGPEWMRIQRPAIRYLHRWPPGGLGGDNLLFNSYVPYRWHHVVAQMDGDRMELYLNGTPLPPLSVSPDRGTEVCQFLVGELIPQRAHPRPWDVRPFVGQIDEVALYDHPLNVKEIRHHSALGSTGRRPSEP